MNTVIQYSLVFLGILLSTMSAAYADAGEKMKTIWNPSSTEEATQLLLNGNRICEGDKRQHVCAIYVSLLEEIQLQHVSRPRGLNKNQSVISLVTVTVDPSDPTKLIYVRNEAGDIDPRLQNIAEQENAASMWTRGISNVPQAAANGVLQGVVSNVLSPCRKDGACGNSTTIQNYNAGAQALAGAQLENTNNGSTEGSVTVNTCGSGTCAGAPD